MKKRRNAASKKPSSSKTSLEWLCVLKVDDAVAPRRTPGKPNVRVEALSVKPGPELDNWVIEDPRAKKLRITGVLYPEMPAEDHPGGLLRPYKCPDEQARVEEALKRLRENLRCRGYTVNGSQTTWRLYVIELDETKIPSMKPEHIGAVYVGETSLTRQERADQHRQGTAKTKTGKSLWSKPCHRYFKRPRTDLLPRQFQREYFCRSSAKLHETKLRLYFVARNYKVFGGKDRLERLKKKRKPKS